ncbi:putative atp-dependent clp protease proteolytic subunit protein [Lasiodiplodia theobromae]|nr:putative atp-dependent clp protease proteolytic subunit protein [Lasiodiplodia theobromae]
MRPLRRAASTKASDNTSASAPQDSPHNDPSNERDKYTNNGHATYRKHPSGKRDLPLPPIMDPISLAARERWTEPKMPEPRREDLTPFQRKLYANPAAHALSTSIRADRTSTVLPSFFYLSLHPKPHPTTSAPWMLPLELADAAKRPPKKKSKSNSAEPQDAQQQQQNKPHRSVRTSPSSYVALRQTHLRNIRTANKGTMWEQAVNTRARMKLLGRQDGDGDDVPPPQNKPHQKLVWREDMDEMVLRLLRDLVARRLEYGFSKPRGGGLFARMSDTSSPGDPSASPRQPAPSSFADCLARIPDAGAVLFLRRVTSEVTREVERRVRECLEAGDGLVDQLVKIRETTRRTLKEEVLPRTHGILDAGGPRLQPSILYPPLDYPSVRCVGRQEGKDGEVMVEKELPVYDLVELLGPTKLEELVKGTVWETETVVVLREKETTIGAHHALMQLQDYVIESV